MQLDLKPLAAVLHIALGVRVLESHGQNERFSLVLDVPRSPRGWDALAILAQVGESCEDELVLLVRAPNSKERFRVEIIGHGSPEDLAIWLAKLCRRERQELTDSEDTDLGDETAEWLI